MIKYGRSASAAVVRCLVSRQSVVLPAKPRKVQRSAQKRTQPVRHYMSVASGGKRNPYDVLGVSKTATQDEIKKAFIQKAKILHPDRNKTDPDAQKKFVELTAAYDTLKDPNKRAQFDSMSQYGFGGDPSSSGGQGFYSARPGYGAKQGNPFAGQNPFGGGFQAGPGSYYETRSSGSRPEEMSPDEFMRWYRANFADAFRDIEEVLRRSGARVYTSRSGPFGRHGGGSSNPFRENPQFGGGHAGGFDEIFGDPMEAMANAFGFGAPKQRKNVGESSFSLPPVFGVEENKSATPDGRYVFDVLTMTGSDLGQVTERSFDEDKGIIVDYYYKSKLLVKARWFRKPDGLEKILVEDASSKRLATIDGEPSRDNSLIAKFISGLALRPYRISSSDGDPIGALTVRDGIKKKIQFFNSRGHLASIITFHARAMFSIERPNLEGWSVESVNGNHEIDPSVFLVVAVMNTLRRRREGTFVDKLVRSLTKLLGR